MSNGDQTANKFVSKIGLWWPDAEEGDIRAAAQAWETFAGAIERAHDEGRGGAAQARANWDGGASEAFGAHWKTFDQALPRSAQGARALAKGLRQFADEVEDAKRQVLELIEEMGATIAVGTVFAVFTAGASEAAAAAAATAIRAAALRIGVQLSARAAQIAGEVVAEAAFGAIESMATDAVNQVARVEVFHDGDYSASELLGAGKDGAVDGAAGAARRAASKGPSSRAGVTPDETPPRVPRSVDDGESLRGAHPDEVEKMLRDAGYKPEPAGKGDGTKWVHPTKKGEQMIVEPGTPEKYWDPDKTHGGPYVKISRNSKVSRIPLEGNPGLP